MTWYFPDRTIKVKSQKTIEILYTFQPEGVSHMYVLDCSRIRRDICAKCFCIRELRRVNFALLLLLSDTTGCALFQAHTFWARLLVFKETFLQTVFAFVNCAIVGLSVFYFLVLTCSLIFLQL